jgi:hypothetical protein
MTTFKTPLDIKNRALQHCGARRLRSEAEDSVNAGEVNFAYDKVRIAELRRNVWTAATRRAVLRPVVTNTSPITLGSNNPGPTMLFIPGTWSPTQAYLTGSIVQFNGEWYVALQSVPIGQEPDLLTEGSDEDSYWSQYFGPTCVTPWVFNAVANSPQPWSSIIIYAAGAQVVGSDNNIYSSNANGNAGNNPVGGGGTFWTPQGTAATGSGYFAGELVYMPTGPSPGIYVSLNTGNSDIPTTVPQYVSSAVYSIGQTVLYNGQVAQSLQDLNVGQSPTNGAFWGPVPANQPDQMMGTNWLKLGAAKVRSLQLVYPAGSGPITQSSTRNLYRLPYGYLKEASQDPKAGSTSYLGAPSGLSYEDWVFENGFIVTREVYPITFRFVADIVDVSIMDPMFCEGLAARLAWTVIERLTQAEGKLKDIVGAYKQVMGEARIVNAIEQGPTESPEDDFITCRR